MAAPYHGMQGLLNRFFGPLLPLLVIFIYFMVCQGGIPGLNAVNTTIYFAAGLLFIPSILQSARTSALTDLRKSGLSDYYVFSNSFNRNKDGTEDTWAGLYDKTFRIAFYGYEQGINNGKEVLKTMNSTPRIVWIRPGTWGIFAIAILVLDVVFYTSLGDTDSFFLSYVFYYVPSLLALCCPVLSFAFVKIRDNYLYRCAVKIVSDRNKEMAVNTGSGMKMYHSICPKCGTSYAASILHCINCGSSLEVVEGDTNLNSIRMIRNDD